MNILIIEDDLFLSEKIKKVFRKRVITNKITLISSYENFINELPIIWWYDIILTDIKLNTLDTHTGIDIVELLRKKNILIPIVIISWYNDINLIDRAFSVWASDYITKPFRLKELEIRIMRWFQAYCLNVIFSHSDIIKYKKLTYKFDTNDFYYKDIKINLTKKSKFILFQLLLSSEKLISEETLREKLWWDRDSFKERNLRVNMLRLKKSLEEVNLSWWIQNKRGEWYTLKKT
jgi:DNA-binding response OmpR family regulator